MAVTFPSTPIPNYPYDYRREQKTLITTFDSGKEQRRRQWRFPKRTISLAYRGLTLSQVSTFWNFYQARTGSLASFNFFEPDVEPYNTTVNQHNDEYVARGDGVTTSFDLPCVAVSTADITVLINGSSQSSGFTITSTGGADNEDLLAFTSNTPASTDIITCDFQGRLKMTMRFADDNISRLQFEADLFNHGIELIEEKRSS